MGFFQNLKEKPYHVKQRIALLSTFLLTAGIVAVWLMTFSASHSGVEANGASAGIFAGMNESLHGAVTSVGTYVKSVRNNLDF